MTTFVIVLSIIAAVIALFALLLIFGRAKIRIIAHDTVKVIVSVLGIRFTVFSNAKKNKKIKSLSRCRHPDRVLKKELRKRRKAARAAQKKREKAKRKKQQKKIKAAALPSPNFKENMEMVLVLLKKIRELTHGKISLRIRGLKISIGTGDAAKTAILYGVVSQSTAYVLEWAQHNFSEVHYRGKDIQIIPAYTESRSHAEVDICCSLYLSQIIGIGIRMLIAYRDAHAERLKKARRRTQKV